MKPKQLHHHALPIVSLALGVLLAALLTAVSPVPHGISARQLFQAFVTRSLTVNRPGRWDASLQLRQSAPQPAADPLLPTSTGGDAAVARSFSLHVQSKR